MSSLTGISTKGIVLIAEKKHCVQNAHFCAIQNCETLKTGNLNTEG